MSVILDALKRVQDENRRRGGSGEKPEPRGDRDERSPNALLRRLSEPADAPPPSRDGMKVSPVIWASGALVLLVLLVAAGLAWFQPTFDGPAVNDGRPLLTQFDGRPAGSPAASPASGAVRESFGGSDPSGASGNGANDGRAAAMAADDEEEGGSDLFSDLSANLDSADESVASAPASAAEARTPAEDDSMLRLEVEERPTSGGSDTGSASAQPNDAFLDIRSATPGQVSGGSGAASPQREWVPPTPVREADPVDTPTAEDARVPTRLVDPGVRAAFAEGVRRHKSGDLGGAAEAYERALKLDPGNARVNANLGVLYEAQGKLVAAERHLREAVQTEPDNAAAHNNLGVVLYRQGKYDAALIEFNRTLQLDPRRLDAYTNKGLIYTRWGQLDDAERSFRQVLAIDPANALAHYNLGLVYEEMGQIGPAVESYYRFLEHGGVDHPEITDYLDRHLRWLERGSPNGGGTGS